MLRVHLVTIPKLLRTTLANITGWQVLRIILGLTLLVAALFKVHELSTIPYLDKFPPRWVMIVFIELEILFALWLLFVPKKLTQITWLATLGLFSFFACVTLYKALIGEASCGCFGRVEINPWYTLIFDSSVVGLLLWFRPKDKRFALREIWLPTHFLRSESSIASLVIVIWFILCIPTAWSMVSFVQTDIHDDLSALGQVFEGPDGKPIVMLKPEKWVGKEFPFLGHIDIEKRLDEGEWIILLFHYDCPDCQNAILVYKSLGDRLLSNKETKRVALIEMPPFDDSDKDSCIQEESCVYARLSSGPWEWFAETPVEIQLNQGIVTHVAGHDQIAVRNKVASNKQHPSSSP